MKNTIGQRMAANFKSYHEIFYRIEYYFFLIVGSQAEKTLQMTLKRRIF